MVVVRTTGPSTDKVKISEVIRGHSIRVLTRLWRACWHRPRLRPYSRRGGRPSRPAASSAASRTPRLPRRLCPHRQTGPQPCTRCLRC